MPAQSIKKNLISVEIDADSQRFIQEKGRFRSPIAPKLRGGIARYDVGEQRCDLGHSFWVAELVALAVKDIKRVDHFVAKSVDESRCNIDSRTRERGRNVMQKPQPIVGPNLNN
jgi:hypothetical protein